MPRALYEAGATANVPCPVRSGIYGIAWNLMGVNGMLTLWAASHGAVVDCGGSVTIAKRSAESFRGELHSLRDLI